MAARGAQIVDIRRHRIARLEASIARDLVASDYVNVDASEVYSVDEWRAAARAVGRRQGLRIRTGTSSGDIRVWAVRVDEQM